MTDPADLAAAEARLRVRDWSLHYVANGGRDRVSASYPDTPLFASDLSSLLAQVERLGQQLHDMDATTYPRTWAGLLAFLDAQYPDDVFGTSGDPGPQITRLTREVAGLRQQLAAVRVALISERPASIRVHDALVAAGGLTPAFAAAAAAVPVQPEPQETDDE